MSLNSVLYFVSAVGRSLTVFQLCFWFIGPGYTRTRRQGRARIQCSTTGHLRITRTVSGSEGLLVRRLLLQATFSRIHAVKQSLQREKRPWLFHLREFCLVSNKIITKKKKKKKKKKFVNSEKHRYLDDIKLSGATIQHRLYFEQYKIT